MNRRVWFAASVAAGLLGGGALRVAADPEAGAKPCNPYFPLPVGASWTYREGPVGKPTLIEKTTTVTSASRDGARESAVLEQTVRTPNTPGVAVGRARTTVHCDGGRIGMIVQGSARGKKGDRAASGSITARLPGLAPADELVPGYEWRGKSEIEAVEGDRRVVTRGVRQSRVAGKEAVSVPAGRYPEALKIVSIETLESEGGQGARAARQEFVEWYVRDVGLVKRETRVRSGANEATTVELLTSTSLKGGG